MASPQVENGYIKIANELFDALISHRIPGEQMQCLLLIFRKTYGWQKTEDAISLSQFAKYTGISKPHCIRAIKELIKKRFIIIAKKGNDGIHIYRIIKDYTKWRSLPKKATLPKKEIGVAKNGNKPLPKMVPTKDIIKDTITKDIYSDVFLEFWKAYPKKVAKKAALKAYKKISQSKKQLQVILDAIEKQKQTDKWRKNNGQFIPNPATWLNGGCWEDEVEIEQKTEFIPYRKLDPSDLEEGIEKKRDIKSLTDKIGGLK